MSGKINFSLLSHSSWFALSPALGHRQFLSLYTGTSKAASRIHAEVMQVRVNPSTDMAQVTMLPWGWFLNGCFSCPQLTTACPWPAWPLGWNSLGDMEAFRYRWS